MAHKKQIGVFIAIILSIVVVSGCTNNTNDKTTYLNTGDIIPNDICYGNNLQDKVVVFTISTCPACKATLPKLKMIEAKMPDVEFEYIVLDTEKGKARANELKIWPYGVPTVIVNCVAYGIMSQEEYEEIILRTR